MPETVSTGICLLMLLLPAWAAQDPSPSQPQAPPADLAYNGQIIASIEFRPAQQPYPAETLQKLLALRTGQSLTTDDVRATIQNLFNTGRYNDVQIEANPVPEGRRNAVAIVIATELNYFVAAVTVSGAKEPPSEGQLASASKLQLGRPFEENDALTGIENLEDRLRSNGLYQAKVTYHIDRIDATQEARIHFTVDAGKRARFDGINIVGDPNRSLDQIIRASHWKIFYQWLGWHQMNEARVRTGVESIRRTYQSANQLLSRVSLLGIDYHTGTNTVTPRIRFEPGPKVQIRSTGTKISRGQLKNLVPVYQERTVDRDLLVEGKRNLLDYFQAQGYFDATVDFQLLPPNDGEQIVEYTLDRGTRHRLRTLSIEGNHYFKVQTIRERMAVTPATFLRFPHGRFSQKMLEKDVEAILQLYRSNGFREVAVESSWKDENRTKTGDLDVTLKINEGPQSFVRSLKIDGANAEELKLFGTTLNSLEGQPYSESAVAEDRDEILSYYFNRGYPDAVFEWTVDDTGTPNQVDLHFTIRTGRRQFVRDILINGLRTTRPELVSSRIRSAKGEPLAESSLSDTQRRLYDLGIFAKVQVATQNPDGEEDARYILYQLDEASRYSLTTGFGAEVGRIGGGTTLDAPAGTAGFSPRVSLGLSRLNFLGLGHTVSLQSRVSDIQQRVLSSYFAPHFRDNEKLNLTVSILFDNSHDVRTFAARRLEGSIQLGQRLSRANSLQYRFQYRRVTVDQSTLNINPQLIPLFSQPTRTGIFSMSYIHDRRDDPIDAHRGLYNTIDAGVSSSAFGSRTSFWRLLERNSTYHRINNSLVFARSTNIGLMSQFDGGADSDIPLPERFFSGGSFSHRGFPNNQAGPRDSVTGFPLGGSALFMNTLELRYPLYGDNLSGALFHDAGNVYSSIDKMTIRSSQRNVQDFDYMVHAIGMGFRYRTPVGPLRVDFSYSPNAPRFVGFQGTRDQLLYCAGPGSLGTVCPSVSQRISAFQFHFSLGQSF